MELDMDIDIETLVLTTVDNPFNPKTEYLQWYRWDHENGYDTEAYVARLVADEIDIEVDDEFALEMVASKVIDEILQNDDQGIYVLV